MSTGPSPRINPAVIASMLRLQREREQAALQARRRVLLIAVVLGGLALAGVMSVVAMLSVPAIGAGVAYQLYHKDVEAGLAKLEQLDQRQTFETNYVYDRNGTLLLEFWGEGRRVNVPLSAVSQHLIDATIATEDKSFWTNQGVDPQAVLRALFQNSQSGGIRSGASTITQQLVRAVVFSYEERFNQSYDRKIKEGILAYLLNRMRSKDEILTLYLNEINYGHLAYGIEAAAQVYFDKHASDLTLAEASLLAGLPQSPAELDPLDPARADAVRARQRTVLDLMVDQGFITRKAADAAFKEVLHYRRQVVDMKAPHFVNYVRQELVKEYGAERVAQGGLHITTTLDLRLEDRIQQIVFDHVQTLSDTKHLTNAAVVVTRPDTGEILAMVGSANYYDQSIDGQVNMADSERQPGSSIKPLVYSAAFEMGLTPGVSLYDQPTTFIIPGSPPYKPVNYDGKFHGQVTLRTAMANSYNIPAVKVLRFVGVTRFIDFAHRLGITGLNRGREWYGLSLSLGGGEVKLVDMVGAYGVLANQGDLVRPTPFLKIVDSRGNILYQLDPQRQRVLDPRVAFMTTSIMSDDKARVPAFGVNTPLKVSRPAAVKTGTTNDWKDNWTLGFTPYAVVGVWAGNADNTSMRNSTGVTGAAPIWHDVMETIFADPAFLHELYPAGEPPLEFSAPAGVVRTNGCVPTGQGSCKNVEDWFMADNIPGKGGANWLANVRYKNYRVLNLSEDGTTFCLPTAAQAVPDNLLVDLKLPEPDQQVTADVGAFIELVSRKSTLKERDDGATAPSDNRVGDLPACTDQDVAQVMQAAGASAEPGAEPLPPGVAYAITSPGPGQAVQGVLPVMGTATLGPGFVYYKVEIAGSDGRWVTIGAVHNQGVVNGQLEVLHADALPAGQYFLRLVMVRDDSNYPPPYVVPITIGPPGP